MKMLKERMPDVFLLAVGEFYDDQARYADAAHRHHLDDVIRFVSEYVPNEEVGTYFSASDIVVLPYLSATQSGIAQIAYNFNRPLVVTDVGGLAEVVVPGKTGLIVPPNDPRSLADAAKRFFDEKLGPVFEINVREEKKKYTWDNLVRSIEHLTQQSSQRSL
jgi:glycosyltransferase involved in cell wall biosynthesis